MSEYKFYILPCMFVTCTKFKTSNITLSYLFTTNPTTTESRNIYDPLPVGIPLTLNDLHSDSEMRGTEHTFQADYTTPLSKIQTLNIGAKFIGRRNTSDSKYYNIISVCILDKGVV